MATISLPIAVRVGHPSHFDNVTMPYKVEAVIDFAKVRATKGSNLVATDVIQALSVPAGSDILSAGLQIVAPGDSTTLTLDVGTTGAANAFVAAYDGKSAAGSYAPRNGGAEAVLGTAGTLDVTLNALTGTLTTGSVRVWAVIVDVSGGRNPGIVKYTQY